jgi:hypothetical protein
MELIVSGDLRAHKRLLDFQCRALACSGPRLLISLLSSVTSILNLYLDFGEGTPTLNKGGPDHIDLKPIHIGNQTTLCRKSSPPISQLLGQPNYNEGGLPRINTEQVSCFPGKSTHCKRSQMKRAVVYR